MPTYFADTSFWVALIDRRDTCHAKAADLSLRISGKILTAEAVVVETANTFAKPNWRPKAIALINHITLREDIEIAYKSWHKAWDLFTDRPDKAWSLTDCISFEVVRERGISEALTADNHFRQAGFQTLLLDS